MALTTITKIFTFLNLALICGLAYLFILAIKALKKYTGSDKK